MRGYARLCAARRSLGLDALVIGTCGWAWNEEMQTKQQNVQRIWDEVRARCARESTRLRARLRLPRARRAGRLQVKKRRSTSKGVNRFERRTKKEKGQKKQNSRSGFHWLSCD